jgi:hypothetical protein
MFNYQIHSIETAPEKSKPLLELFTHAIGFVTNLVGAIANSPVVTNSLLGPFKNVQGGFTEAELPYAEKLARLTQLYLRLNLPLEKALRAAEADLCHICRPIRLSWPIVATFLGQRGRQLRQKMAVLQEAIPDWNLAGEADFVPADSRTM